MESEANPATIVHKAPPLNSDQLNYLIWRYLQESGYAEAAVKLQRDWNVDAGDLPYAKHIKGQALVTLVQKGLRYHHLSLTVDENGQQTRPLQPDMFFFGPESSRDDISAAPKEALIKAFDPDRAISPASNAPGLSRRQGRDNIQNGTSEPTPQPAKRGRKSAQHSTAEKNGGTGRKASNSVAPEPEIPNGHSVTVKDVTSPVSGDQTGEEAPVPNGLNADEKMEIDKEQPGAAANVDTVMEETMDDALPPLVPTLTNGESIGVQVAPAKVVNLGPASAILSLLEGKHITKALWRPTDASILTAQGEDFCGIWRLDGLDLQPESVKPLLKSLFGPNESTLITAAAWEPSGSLLAVATYSDQEGQIHLFDGQELTLIETLPASQRAVVSLKWQPRHLRLVGIAASDDQSSSQVVSSTILVWDLSQEGGATAPLSLIVPGSLVDIDCASQGNTGILCATGQSVVYYCRIDPTEIVIGEKWHSRDNKDEWAFIRCLLRGGTQSMLVAASAEKAHVWLPARNILIEHAHEAPITGLEVRRRAYSQSDANSSAEFATSSMDGSVKVWKFSNATEIVECTHRLSIGSSIPIMALSFSPDGFCLAAASYANAHIWNAEHGYPLMASWQGNEPEWRGSSIKDDDLVSAGGVSSTNGENGSSSADHTLAWHADSKKLAFGVGTQVVVINFQR